MSSIKTRGHRRPREESPGGRRRGGTTTTYSSSRRNSSSGGGGGSGRAAVRDETKVFVSNISRECGEADILRLFEQVAPVNRVQFKNNFAFVQFDEPWAASEAVRNLNGSDMFGRRLMVDFYQYRGGDPRYSSNYNSSHNNHNSNNDDSHQSFEKWRGNNDARRSRGYRVLVSGLDRSTSWQDLKDFGRLAGRSVTYADTYQSRGRREGLIEYHSYDDFANALRTLDGKRLNGACVAVYNDEVSNRDVLEKRMGLSSSGIGGSHHDYDGSEDARSSFAGMYGAPHPFTAALDGSAAGMPGFHPGYPGAFPATAVGSHAHHTHAHLAYPFGYPSHPSHHSHSTHHPSSMMHHRSRDDRNESRVRSSRYDRRRYASHSRSRSRGRRRSLSRSHTRSPRSRSRSSMSARRRRRRDHRSSHRRSHRRHGSSSSSLSSNHGNNSNHNNNVDGNGSNNGSNNGNVNGNNRRDRDHRSGRRYHHGSSSSKKSRSHSRGSSVNSASELDDESDHRSIHSASDYGSDRTHSGSRSVSRSGSEDSTSV